MVIMQCTCIHKKSITCLPFYSNFYQNFYFRHLVNKCAIIIYILYLFYTAYRCPSLTTVANGVYLTNQAMFHYRDNVTLQCMDGYYITEYMETTVSETTMCNSDGVWTKNLTCSRMLFVFHLFRFIKYVTKSFLVIKSWYFANIYTFPLNILSIRRKIDKHTATVVDMKNAHTYYICV